MSSEAPRGFRLIERTSPFNTNSRGICHGGVLATLADLASGAKSE